MAKAKKLPSSSWRAQVMDIPVSDITQKIVQEAINEDAKIHSPKAVRNNHGRLISAVLHAEAPRFRS
ncbi:MAG TPA: hypothetical protein H9717_08040 [Candidatus Eisenbergiella merdipullorum]|uniref:Uncharacterized protein n=1 Tax=Candidatus Eisenbergiella merdipullorum TaxID=2838553 RepID=A0A9D2I6M8_9FIRM|nr:hypothetical protein [Candidatus Eisenbergiella merdipullorum]